MNRFNRFIWGGIVAVAIGGFAMFNVSLLTVCTGRRSTADGIKKKKYCTVDGGACSYSSNGTGS
ncbi:MAG: hypothetical protein LBG80_05265 [Bacteroidales bacterium]|jgi:hypothetical protein|nr:hypothetical protein [Bacteroidales bacterium]